MFSLGHVATHGRGPLVKETRMGLFDKAKDFAGDNPDKVDQGVEKAGDLVDDKTGGKHSEQVDKGQDFVGDRLGGAEGGNDQQQ